MPLIALIKTTGHKTFFNIFIILSLVNCSVYNQYQIPASFKEDLTTKQKIKSVFSLLNTNIIFFERKFGVAKYITNFGDKTEYREYEIDSCKISAEVVDKSIRKLTLMNISKNCDYQPENVSSSLWKSSFGDIYNIYPYGGEFFISCLRGCGNAVVPQTIFIWGGSHAQNWIQEAIYGEDFYEYSDALEGKIIDDLGEDALIDGKFNLDNYDELIRSTFYKTKISSYSIGWSLDK